MSLTWLSHTLDPDDLKVLGPELQHVDHYLKDAHDLGRRWAYAVALHAVGRWVATGRHINDTLYDVGGANSTFSLMLDDWTRRDTIVIDPLSPGGDGNAPVTLAEFVTGGTPLADVVTAHSLLEHVLLPEQVLYHLSCLLAPGGLLVLTMAYWPHCGTDTAIGHEHRQRIYCPKLLAQLRQEASVCQLASFGGTDPMFHGRHLDGDHSLVSLVLEKRR